MQTKNPDRPVHWTDLHDEFRASVERTEAAYRRLRIADSPDEDASATVAYAVALAEAAATLTALTGRLATAPAADAGNGAVRARLAS
jgi:hypothetical protein